MLSIDSPVFKVASEPWEFEQIHELNYQTFVVEIPQHHKNDHHKLIDKYHEQNTYVICLQGKELLGMIALRDKRPLSLDEKLENLELFLPPFKSILEYRLLAVKKQRRNTTIFSGIMKKSLDMALQKNYDIAVISGTTRQVQLYQHLGFKPFGPLVGKQEALYQPMYIDIDRAIKLKKESQVLQASKDEEVERLLFNYLPGPVSIVRGVLDASSAAPHSHRSKQFMSHFNYLRKNLCEKVNASCVHIMTGSGTLANDIVAAQLSILPGRGLVLINGEFGERLNDQAVRAGLDFDSIYEKQGETFDREEIKKTINRKSYEWIWTTHCETSTGVLNDIEMLREICKQHSLKLCLDGISSIGSCEVDLHSIYLASAVSGKGVGSLPGLAMIFCRDDVVSGCSQLPKYFDLGYYKEKKGIPFTISSNAIYALNAAVKNVDWPVRFENTRRWSEEIRNELEGIGLSILANKNCRAPHITTVALPKTRSSLEVGNSLEEEGILVNYRSEYLIEKNYFQICFMGECQKPTRIINHLRT
jgi:aspartate aminotransferase-like enzyme